MDDLQMLLHAVERFLPNLCVEVDVPDEASGRWLASLKRDGHEVDVEWRPGNAFGITSSKEEPGYGDGPDETYKDWSQAAARVAGLFAFREHTTPRRAFLEREHQEEMVSVSKRDLEDLLLACSEFMSRGVLSLKEAAAVVRDLHVIHREIQEEAKSVLQSLDQITKMVDTQGETIAHLARLSGEETGPCGKSVTVTSLEPGFAKEAPGVWSAVTASTICLLPAGHSGKCKDTAAILKGDGDAIGARLAAIFGDRTPH